MAIKVKHITVRDGVYYYVRRVPKAVVDLPGIHAKWFKGQTFFRLSLQTKDQARALELADAAREEFDRLVTQALDLDHRAKGETPITRAVTAELLNKIKMKQRDAIARQFSKYALLRESGGESAEYAETMIEHFEQDASELMGVLSNNESTNDPRFDLDEMTRDVIHFGQLDAPVGSEQYARLKRALREGSIQGYDDASEILAGRMKLHSDISTPTSTGTISISDAVEKHIQRQSKSRTITAIRTASKKFVSLHGDLALSDLKPDHFRKFCSDEASRDIGGRSKGSVKRPVSQGTIQKDLRLLSGVIKGAIDRGEFDGPNPAAGINVSAFARPVSAAVVPDKRPFATEELKRVFAYPWFTGCASSSNIHKAGPHRLNGVFYWGPVLALLTGCRAGELGGLALDEIMIDERYPHMIIRDNAFRTTKGSYRRCVPLIDQLMDLGFGDFVKHRKQDGGVRLFDDWKAPSGRGCP